MTIIWTMEETAIATILDMRGVGHATIAKYLTSKMAEVRGIQEGTIPGVSVAALQLERTTDAVTSKLARIRKKKPELWLGQEKGWNEKAVYEFLSSHVEGDFIAHLMTTGWKAIVDHLPEEHAKV
ncbi:hypothetical protein EYZ11_012782 [Aspergillus tanneri]|uniref:Uncharacterized protein n=1 Tax=Aspergillus tanneri TaxID=1220188 RepID=A0A4S3IZC0_9EURO|nr:hypothetical protein EYZ11_012782 [Aspergillus tanneri]